METSEDKHKLEKEEWMAEREKLRAEVDGLQNIIKYERGNSVPLITTFEQKSNGTAVESGETVQRNSKRLEEEALCLHSVVRPMEEELVYLRAQLKQYKEQSSVVNHKREGLVAVCETVSDSSLDEKVKELHHNLQTEKSSRTDLEMYVAVLSTQKNVLQDETDRLRSQLHEVCKLLEQEKLEHTDLKRTWQMANDQFLESQRLMMDEIRRFESILSTEQKMQVGEMKKLDTLRVHMDQQAQDFEKLLENAINSENQKLSPENDLPQNSDIDTDSGVSSNHIEQVSLNESTEEDLNKDCVDYADNKDAPSPTDTKSSDNISEFGLTNAQQQALLDPTPEAKASMTLLASVKANLKVYPTTGKRLISDADWEVLQKEVRAAREKVNKPCDMCSNYESQLQAAQSSEKRLTVRLNALERSLQGERDSQKSREKYVEELEYNIKVSAERTEAEMLMLPNKVREAEKFLSTVKTHFSRAHTELQEQLKALKESQEDLKEKLRKLEEENDFLVGRHSTLSHEMHEENIDLPDTTEEMQLLLLKYREEIITSRVAHEHGEETLKGEIMFLKSQLIAEQTERATVEENMAEEINQLREELTIHNSIVCEIDRLKAVASEDEAKLIKSEQAERDCRAAINRLEELLDETREEKARLEQEVTKMRLKVSSLQVDLNNSEDVQRDFVKLSQSLQIQLEKIRSSENEVRWQHEEDATECCHCKKPFSVTHRKHHCKHCGQIFCVDCVSKTVNSGPNLRPSKVCDVCHTILVRDATPYFSVESPRTPD